MNCSKNRRPDGRLRAFAHVTWLRRAVLPAVALVAILGACGGRQVPEPDDALEDPGALVDALWSRLDGIERGRIRADVEVFAGPTRGRGRQAVLFEAPDRVRIETISPFDTTLSVLVVRDGELRFYDLQATTFYVGAATAQNLLALAPVPLEPDDVVRVLAGSPPLRELQESSTHMTLRWNRRAGGYTLTAALEDGGRMELDVQHGTWVMLGARRFDASDTLLVDLRAGAFEDAGDGVVVPGRIRVRLPEDRVDVELNVERYDVNPSLPATMFELEVPRGVDVVDLDNPAARP